MAMALEWRRDLEAENVPAEEIQRRLQKSGARLLDAPVVVMLCLDASTVDAFRDKRRQKAAYLMSVQSVAAAGQLLLLATHAEGLGGVWICSPLFAPQAVRDCLGLPETWEAQAMFYVGCPDRGPVDKAVAPLERIARWQ
jgi:F420 biosynthesis protein FbiB-like protein